MNKNSVTKKLSTGLLASAVAISAFALAPVQSGQFNVPAALAEAVRVDAPKAPGFAEVVEAVSPAVVSVRVKQMVHPASDDGEFNFDRRSGHDRKLPEFFRNNPELFEKFFGEEFGNKGKRKKHRNKKRFGMSQGSGFFISEDGYLVTNNHVIDNGSEFTIVLNDGTELDAELVGADERSDLAVLKVNTEQEFTYVSFSDDNPRIGDWVVAVGNPFGLGGTVTAGIVSAHGREIGTSRYDDFIQIDAAVNKGNSGGPAFDLNGEVIGVNTAIFSPSGGNVGIAFAIPAATSRQIVDELIENGRVVRGWLGVQIQPVSTDIADALDLKSASGAMVTKPQEGGPAEASGVKIGDIITSVDGTSVKGPKELARVIGNYDPDSVASLTIIRNGDEMEIEVTLGSLDDAGSGLNSGSKKASPSSLGLKLKKSENGNGVEIADVAEDSPADKKGIRSGDIVASVNGEEVTSPEDVKRIISEARELGRKATLLQINRAGNSMFVAVPLKKG